MRSRSWRVARVASAHPAALGDLGARPRSRARRAAVNAATPLPAAPVTTDRRPLLTNALRREAVATHIVPEVPRLRRPVPLVGAGRRAACPRHSIDLIFAPAYGSNKKNATDIRLAIDALELVFTRPEIGTFMLLSGDSDFSSLVIKLKEYGKYVIGVGIRESSSDLLIQNCDEYFSYNELAGLTKESDVTTERRDPWELVVEAVKQMTAHNDVMRSDRLKQVMQEIDPSFNEKDIGFSRFSKFVVEAAHRGLIHLKKLDNGQYEISLGPGVPGAAAQPTATGAPRGEAPREERPRRRAADGG